MNRKKRELTGFLAPARGLFLEKVYYQEGEEDETDIVERKWNSCVCAEGFLEFFQEADADIFCIQESKMQAGQLDLELEGYHQYWNYAEKKGYSGTAVFTKKEPLSVQYGIGIEEHDKEGRVITLEFEEFYFVTVYTPNSQSELARLSYRIQWETDFLAYLKGLEQKKPVSLCGGSECGVCGDRFEKSKNKPKECRIYRRGTCKIR